MPQAPRAKASFRPTCEIPARISKEKLPNNGQLARFLIVATSARRIERLDLICERLDRIHLTLRAPALEKAIEAAREAVAREFPGKWNFQAAQE